MRLAVVSSTLEPLGKRCETLVERGEFFLLRVLEINQAVARTLLGCQQLVELHLKHQGVLVLGPLDQEDHQKRDDRGSCIDDKLPGVGKTEKRASYGPNDDGRNQIGRA